MRSTARKSIAAVKTGIGWKNREEGEVPEFTGDIMFDLGG